MERPGLFITVEGSEGSGKSTNVALLRDHFRDINRRVICLREPGGTPVSEEIRRLLKRTDFETPIFPETELLLFAASRAQLVREKIQPALQEGFIVICDRYIDSTLAYQGVARNISLGTVETVNAFAIDDCRPDLTFLLDLDPRQGFARIRRQNRGEEDRLEQEAIDFYEAVQHAYRRIAKENADRFVSIDASRPLGQVQEEMRAVLRQRFGI